MTKSSNSDNRQILLQTALSLFARRGYSSVGVQEIVTAAGLSKPTLYHYFGHKQGLLSAVLAEYSPAFLARLERAADYQGDLIKSLEQVAAAYFESAQAEPDFFYLMLSMNYLPAEHETEPLIQPFRDQLQALLESLFVSAVPQHGNLRGHEVFLASSLTGSLNHQALALLKRDAARTGVGFSGQEIHQWVKHYMYGIYVL